MILTFGSAGEQLARSISTIMGATLIIPERRTFPDGEQYMRIKGDVRGQHVAVFQSLAYKPDQLLFEYCLMVDALKGGGARSVIGVFPYLAYARQDQVFRANEPLSARLVPRLIESAGTDRVITVDMHLHRFKEHTEVFRVPAQNLSAMSLLARYYRDRAKTSAVIVIGPDSESEQWARVVSQELGAPCLILEKERLGDREVTVRGALPLEGRTALIVDDMVSTGKTMVEVISLLKKQGISKVDALVTHALLVEGASKRLKDAGLRELFYSDTIPGGEPSISVAPLIAADLIGACK
jgi:ribose-phosphate pyrophosphokinase